MGLKFTFEKRLAMSRAVALLWNAAEGELKRRLGTKPVLNTPGGGRVRSLLEQVHCEYRTSCPAEPFPPDCPTHNDVEDYKELTRRGRTHPKVVNILDWPPNW